MKIDINKINEFEYLGFVLRLRWHPRYKKKAVGYNEEPKEGMWSIHLQREMGISNTAYSKSKKAFIYEALPSQRTGLEDTRFNIKDALSIIKKFPKEWRCSNE